MDLTDMGIVTGPKAMLVRWEGVSMEEFAINDGDFLVIDERPLQIGDLVHTAAPDGKDVLTRYISDDKTSQEIGDQTGLVVLGIVRSCDVSFGGNAFPLAPTLYVAYPF